MHTILIVQTTPSALIAQGRFDFAAPFVSALHNIAGPLDLTMTNPYDTPWPSEALDRADAVIFAGSSVDWSTDAPEAAPLRAAMEAVFASGKPTWGSCNGLQLAAVVLGGAVGASPHGTEVGLARDIRITPEGQGHPMLNGRRDGFAAPCIHRDEVTRLPKGAQRLAGNAHSPVQAMAYTAGGVDFWGTQYHPELPASGIAQILNDAQQDPALAHHLRRADKDVVAADALGSNPAEQGDALRAIELRNWLAHVQVRCPSTAA